MSIGTDKDSQKRMIGELLKSADRYIKAADWNKALDEVGKALAIEPNNMYAMAYKDRINVSLNDDKKKAEEEKVKKLAEEKKKSEQPAVQADEKVSAQPTVVSKEEEKKPEPPKDDKKIEPAKAEPPKQEAKPAAVSPSASAKDDSTSRIDSLRQEFAATQAKLQREVAQLTMQVKEAQALKEATEKNLNAQVISLQQELTSAKQQSGKTDTKELEALKKELEAMKEKHAREVESAREVAKGEMLTQIAILQKELEGAKASAGEKSFQQQGEMILKNMFQKAWQDGTITNDERALMLLLKGAIEMTESKFGEMETASKNDAYINALRSVWLDGVVTPEESDFLTALREKLGIPADEHFRLESQIRKEVKK